MNETSWIMLTWEDARFGYAMTATANTAAWIQSIVSGHLDVGVIVTFCSIGIPAIIGAINYTIRTAGPPVLQLIKDINEARANTLAGKMDSLTAILKSYQDQLEASQRLVAAQKEIATSNENLAKLARDEATTGRDQVIELTKMVADGNNKLRQLSESANISHLRAEKAERLSAEMAEKSAQERRQLQNQLDEALTQLRKNSTPILETHDAILKIADAPPASLHFEATIHPDAKPTESQGKP